MIIIINWEIPIRNNQFNCSDKTKVLLFFGYFTGTEFMDDSQSASTIMEVCQSASQKKDGGVLPIINIV